MPKQVSDGDKSKNLESKLTAIEDQIAKKYATKNYELFGKAECRKTAGIKSRFDLIVKWSAPKESATSDYEVCLDANAADFERKLQQARAAASQESQAQQAKLRLPFPTVGMTAGQVRTGTMLGQPKAVNSTEHRRGRREQWVYDGGTYLYFENGVPTAIQSRN